MWIPNACPPAGVLPSQAEIRTAERERFLRRKRKEALGDEFLTLTGGLSLPVLLPGRQGG